MRRGTSLLVALALGGVAACSDPRAGSLPPPASPTVSQTTASTGPPTQGDYASQFRRAITAYYAALTAAANDPARNTNALELLISPTCTCREVLDMLRAEAARGHRLDYTYRVEGLKIVEVNRNGGVALYSVVQSPGSQRDSRGRVLASYPGSNQRFSAEFVRRNDQWLLNRANQVKQ